MTSLLMVIFRPACTASCAILTASAMTLRPSASSHTPRVSGYGTGGHVAMAVFTTWTTVRVTFFIAASRAAQHTAAFDAGEPSTPTTMPRGPSGADISG